MSLIQADHLRLQAVRAINGRRCGELRDFFTNISAEILSVIDSSRSPSFCRRFERLMVVDAGNWGSSPTIIFNNYICAEILSVIDSSQSPSFCRRSELICKLFYFCSKGAASIEQQQVFVRASKEYGAQEIKKWILFDPKFCVETWRQETWKEDQNVFWIFVFHLERVQLAVPIPMIQMVL